MPALMASAAIAFAGQGGGIPRAASNDVALKGELVTVVYHRGAGTMDIVWKDGHSLRGLASAATLEDGRELATDHYPEHALEQPAAGAVSDGLGVSREYTIRSSGAGLPPMLQHIWLYPGKPWVVVEAELSPQASSVGTRHFDTVITRQAAFVQGIPTAALRMLHVPFDNDMWFRYDSMPVAGMTDGKPYSSEEVTAIYDNASRQGLIVGSIAHDTWKTALDATAAHGVLASLDVYGGIASPTGVRTDTHDTISHGVVLGAHVISPRVFIGSFADWRDGLEAFGRANAAIQPPLAWPGGAPMGWNSWAAYGGKINERRYLDSGAFIQDVLAPQGFGKGRQIYINLDAFWWNLDAVQLVDAVDNIRSMHAPDGKAFEPGIYWTPFAYFFNDLDAYVEGTGRKYRYRDILLKGPDGKPLPKVDGGWPIDPSHPGEKERIDFTLQRLRQLGFRYIKVDFLSHGALEGKHFDPAIQTGIEAYNQGMKRVLDDLHGSMFVSLSIAPLFPSGYGNARRLSCDTKGHISGGNQTTEYMLNSLTYGWWTNKALYIADPDHVVLGAMADEGARSVTEGKSRLLSAIISGGMILDSSDLADDKQSRDFARAVYSSPPLFAVANQQEAFRPVEGDTGSSAADAFYRRSASGFYLAVFNYNAEQAKTIAIPLERIDPKLASARSVAVKDLASGEILPVSGGSVRIPLEASASRLVELRPAD